MSERSDSYEIVVQALRSLEGMARFRMAATIVKEAENALAALKKLAEGEPGKPILDEGMDDSWDYSERRACAEAIERGMK